VRVSARWLQVQQLVAARAAHELKNALNGVAVNLEVVRGRLGRAAEPGTIVRFADTAADQLELLVRDTEALLAVVRPGASPCDVGEVARQLHVLLERSGADGSALVLEAPAPGIAVTRADPTIVRIVVAALLLAALDAAGPSDLAVRAGPDGDVQLHLAPSAPVELDAELAELAGDAGVRVETSATAALIVTFPAAPAVLTA
jgi:signal transduction histidine kinase